MKYYGVTERINGTFTARVTNSGQTYALGTYNTAQEAALAYNDYVIEHNFTNRLNMTLLKEAEIITGITGVTTTTPITTVEEEAVELNKTYGWNVIPMYHFYRDADGSKNVKMIDWQKYKAEPFNLTNWLDSYKALAIITGKISNLTILDIDSEEAANALISQLEVQDVTELAEYVVKTTKGYQLFYTYEPNTKTRIAIQDKIDFLSGGVTFAHSTNQGYTVIKNNIPKPIPDDIRAIIITDESQPTTDSEKAFEQALRENSILPYKNPLIHLLKDFIDATRLSKYMKEDLEKVFCTKTYSTYKLEDFAKKGQIHSSMLYVAGIVAANPTVSQDVYVSFMNNWAVKVAKVVLDERENYLIQKRIDAGMNYFRYDINWKQKSEETNNIKANLAAQDTMVWFDPVDEKYVMYTPKTNRLLKLTRLVFKERVAAELNFKNPERDIKPKDVDTHDLICRYETFDPTVDAEFYLNQQGEEMHNMFKRSKMLRYFQTVQPKETMPPFINFLINHLYPNKEEQDMFLHTLAYHMTHLQVSPTTYVLTGKSGTGKNTLMQTILQEIYGDTYLKITADTLTGKFRHTLKNKLLVFIDEVSEKGHKPTDRGSIHNVIKQIVANKEITIEAKGRDEQTYPNHALYVMASNREQPFKLEEGFDRRINITQTNPENIRNLYWFPKHLSTQGVDELIKNEVQDFVAYLASIPLDHTKWSRTIENKQRASLIEASVSDIIKFVEAIKDKNVEALIELDWDFGHFFEEEIVIQNKSYITIKDLKTQLGDKAARIIKALKEDNFTYRKVKDMRALIINPAGTSNTFTLSEI